MKHFIFLTLTSLSFLKATKEYWPIEFKLCAMKTLFTDVAWYNHFGYENDEKMYLGQNIDGQFGWAGFKEGGGHFNVAGK